MEAFLIRAFQEALLSASCWAEEKVFFECPLWGIVLLIPPFPYRRCRMAVIMGWDMGVKSMKKGEKAVLYISPDLGCKSLAISASGYILT